MSVAAAVAGGGASDASMVPRRVRDATTEPVWVRRVLIAVALAFLTVFLFVPLVAVFVEALAKGVGVYLAAISEPDAAAAIRLTLLVAAISVPLNVVFGIAAAWSIAKFDFRGKNLLFIAVFSLQVVPIQVALVPLLSLFSNGVTIGNWAVFPGLNLNGVDGSFARIWIAHTIFALPLAIFLLHNFIAALPVDIMEAARIDGASHGQTFFRIVLPLARPAIASFAILQFLWVWNDLLVATIFTSGDNFPITKLLTDLAGTYGQTWYLLSAGTFLAIVIPLVVFFSLQRYFVRGLLAGATKG